MNSFKKSYERIKLHLGFNYDAATLDALSDEELIKKIDESTEWDTDLMREACYRAGMIEEWEDDAELCAETNVSYFEDIYYRAEKILKKRIEEEKEREVER